MHKLLRVGVVGIAIVPLIVFSNLAFAQSRIEPDETLGNERSQVINRGVRDFDIDGGARRGSNLFHSFREFGVDQGGSVYFLNPTGVENIFSRVTGVNRSDVSGTLGVRGAANLFLMNPNGILFGPSASLDIQGSFVATTANAIGFGDLGFFSATNPEVPSQLLTVNPSAFLFNQIPTQNIPSITNQANVGFGLRVGNGENLLLLGGNVISDGGKLSALEGQVEIGAVASIGVVGLNLDGSLSFPTNLVRGEVMFMNGSQVDVAFNNAGDLGVTARNIDVSGSSLLKAGIDVDSGTEGSQAGDLTLNATGNIQVRQGSRVGNDVYPGAVGESGNIIITANSLYLLDGGQIRAALGSADPDNRLVGAQGKAGNIQIKLSDAFMAVGSGSDGLPSIVFTGVGDGAIGNGGNIDIQASSLSFTNGAQIMAVTFGQGDAGRIDIRANDAMVFDGVSTDGDSTSILGYVGDEAVGDGGDINIEASSLSLSNGSQILADTYGQGNAGKISIRANDAVVFDGIGINGRRSGIFSSVYTASRVTENRIAGNITIDAGSVALTDGAGIVSNVERGSVGEGGNVVITADSLNLTNGGQIQVGLQESNSVSGLDRGQSRAGNIQINLSDDFVATGIDSNGFPSGLISGIVAGAVGSGGNINIQAGSLSFTNGAQISSETYGQGNSGKINIHADGEVIFDGVSVVGNWRSGIFSSVNAASGFTGNRIAGDITVDASTLTVSNGAQIAGNVEAGAVGTGGDINIKADDLNLTNGGQIQATLREANSASGLAGAQGNAGNIRIALSDAFTAIGTDGSGFPSGLVAGVGVGAIGTSGNINLQSNSMLLTQGAQLVTQTLGEGNAGKIDINVDNRVFIEGSSPSGRFSGMFSNVERTGNGRGGNIIIFTDELFLTDGGRVNATSLGKGNAGNVRVTTDSIDLVGVDTSGGFASGIFSEVAAGATGDGGSIDISTNELSLTDGGNISTTSYGNGRAGNIRIDATDRVSLDGTFPDARYVSAIVSNIEDGIGQGGDIVISTDRFSTTNGAVIGASTLGQGRAGNISIDAHRVSFSGTTRRGFSGGVYAISGQAATGRGGTITINSDSLLVTDGAVINAQTFSTENGGSILINTNTFAATDGGQVITTTTDRGQAGTIELNVTGNMRISGSDSTYARRLERFGRFTDPSVKNGNQGVINQGATSGIFANTRSSSNGNGGSIRITTTNLELSNRARISAQSQGTGEAGGLTIQARGNINLRNHARISTESQSKNAFAGDITIDVEDALTSINSDVTTSATNASGGDISLTASDVRLLGDSDVRTNSAREGGNITLNADTIVAFGDSDIFASALEGRGGNIILNTPAFFGENYQSEASKNADIDNLESNYRVDINATGTVSSGNVQTPNTDFIQNSLSDLSETAIDADQLLANSCIARNESGGTFLITGSGGLPESPDHHAASTYATGEVRSILVEATTQEDRSWHPGDAIIEPQGVYRLPDGRLVMSRECELQTK